MADTSKQFLIQFLATIQGDKVVVNSLKQIEKTAEGVSNNGGRHLKSFATRFQEMARHSLLVIPIWQTLHGVWKGFEDTLKGTFEFLVEWEVQMAKIRMVGKMTADEIVNLSSGLLRLSSAYGVASKDIGEVTSLWVAQGKSFTEVMSLMNATVQLSILSGKSMSQSVEDLTGLMKNYGVASEDVMKIIDSLVNVEHNHSISMKTQIDALKAVGPMAHEVGVSFQQMTAIITATHEVTKQAGEAIGVSWRTIFTRIATGAGEAITNIADVGVYLTEAGEASAKQTTNLRNLGDVLDELAMKWGTLSQAQQLAITDKVAGKRQATPFVAYMGNYKESIKAQAQATFGAGTGEEDVKQLTETLQNRITGVVESWKLMASTIGNTNFIKAPLGAIEAGLKAITFAVSPATANFNDFMNQMKSLETETDKQLFTQNGLMESWSQMGRYNDIFKKNPELAKQWSGYLAEVYSNQMKVAGIEVPIWIHDTEQMFGWLNQNLPNIQKKMMDLMTTKQEIALRGELAATIKEGENFTTLLKEINTMTPTGVADYAGITARFKAGTLTPEDVAIVKSYFEAYNPNAINSVMTVLDKYMEKQRQLNNIDDMRIKSANRLLELEKERKASASMLSADQARESMRQIEIKGVETQKSELTLLKEKKAYLESHSILYDDQLEKQRETLDVTISRKEAELSVARALKDEDVFLAQMKLGGASELEVEAQRLVLMEQRKVGEEKIYDQKKRLQILAIQTLDQEKEKMTSLYLLYEKADEKERSRLRRMMELRQMSKEDLSKQYETNPYDAKIIEQYMSNFSKEQQTALGEMMQKKYELPEAKLPIGTEELPSSVAKSLDVQIVGDFWDTWIARAKNSLDFFRGEWTSIANGTAPGTGTPKAGTKTEVGTTMEQGRLYEKYVNKGESTPIGVNTTVDVKLAMKVEMSEKSIQQAAELAGKQAKDAVLDTLTKKNATTQKIANNIADTKVTK